MEISATLSSPVPAEELGSGGSRPNTTVGQHSAMAPIPSGRHLPQRARGKQSSGMAHRESNLHLQQHPSNLSDCWAVYHCMVACLWDHDILFFAAVAVDVSIPGRFDVGVYSVKLGIEESFSAEEF